MIMLLDIIAQLIFIMLALTVIGLPLFIFLKSKIMSYEDIEVGVAQVLVLSVYFGALLLYIMALIPLHAFKYEVIIAMLLLCLIFLITRFMIILKNNRKQLIIKFKKNLSETVIVLTFFFISLIVQAMPLTTLIFGSIHDTSLHALFAQLILENGCIPETHEPYLPAAIIFPQGASVIFAFSSLILSISTPLAVFRTTALFNALTVLAAYNFGRLDKRRYARISYAFIFTFVSMWPTHITWGGNTFVVGVPLFLIIASFLKSEYSRSPPSRQNFLFYIIMGMLLGYIAAIHLALFISLMVCWLLLVLLSCRSFPRMKPRLNQIMSPLVMFIISITLISPYLYRGLMYYHLPGGNIGLPADVVDSQQSLIPLTDPRITLNKIKDFILTITTQYNISPYPVTRIMTIVLLSLLALTLVVSVLRRKRITPAETIGSTLCLASALLFLMEPINPVPTISHRANLIFYISLMLLLGGFNLRAAEIIYSRLSSIIKSQKKLILIITIVIMVSVYSPFIYYRVIEDPWTLTKMYQIFAVTTTDDLNLMLWMKDNLQPNSTILINPFEPGLFIPALAQKKSIYPLSAYHLSASYGKTVVLLANNTLNPNIIDYLKSNNITHVYIGSKSTALPLIIRGSSIPTKWNPYLFINNPNFKLVKRIGNAFLFECLLVDPRMVLMDGFEYDNLDYGGWKVVEQGNGTGSSAIVDECAFEGSRSLLLRVRSEKAPYWLSVLRPVHLYDSSNVTMSFYVNAVKGFGPKDALMIIISDTHWNRQLYFTTNPRVPLKYMSVHLPSNKGYFEFNISKLWKDVHGEQLPASLFIQVLNYDEDCVENVAYIDAIGLSINKSYIFAQYAAKFVYKFELSDSPLYGWKYSEEGRGVGAVRIISDETLLLMAQCTLRDFYWSSVYTDVRLLYWSGHNIRISFHVNATKGFGEYDALMIIISDQSWNRQLYLSTNSEIPIPTHQIIPISNSVFQKFNLTDIWIKIHSEPLPGRFFLQVLNYDRDGIENVAFISMIEIEVD